MSVGVIVLLLVCSSGVGAGLAFLLARRGPAAELARLTQRLDELERSAGQAKAKLTQALEEAAQAKRDHDAQRARTEEAEREVAAATAASEACKRQLEEAEGERDRARQRAEALAEPAEPAGEAPRTPLEALKNDPALGPGQYETLRLMYEQFTAKSVLQQKK